MRTLRRNLRLLVLCGFTAVLYAVWLVCVPFAALLARADAWRAALFSLWARGAGWIVGMRVETRGAAPAGPELLVANHLSYVDIILLAGRMRCVFVSKSDVSDWPVVGHLARAAGTLFVDRANIRDVSRVSALIADRLERGLSVVLFPEGTSSPGSEVGSFHSSLLEPAARAGLPVRYAAVRYSTPTGEPPAHLAVSWWGEMTFVPHLLELLELPHFEAGVDFGGEPIRDPDRKSLATRLHAAVSARFTPTTETEDTCLATAQ